MSEISSVVYLLLTCTWGNAWCACACWLLLLRFTRIHLFGGQYPNGAARGKLLSTRWNAAIFCSQITTIMGHWFHCNQPLSAYTFWTKNVRLMTWVNTEHEHENISIKIWNPSKMQTNKLNTCFKWMDVDVASNGRYMLWKLWCEWFNEPPTLLYRSPKINTVNVQCDKIVTNIWTTPNFNRFWTLIYYMVR